MTRIDKPSWIRRVGIALSGLARLVGGGEMIELLANLAWLG